LFIDGKRNMIEKSLIKVSDEGVNEFPFGDGKDPAFVETEKFKMRIPDATERFELRMEIFLIVGNTGNDTGFIGVFMNL